MGGREVPFFEDAICDICGAKGAYDFMGDYSCPDCTQKAFNEDMEKERAAKEDWERRHQDHDSRSDGGMN